MSSIPSSKMKHAHAHEGEHPEQAHTPTHQAEAQGGDSAKPANDDKPAAPQAATDAGYADPEPGVGTKLSKRAKDLGERAKDLGEEAVDAVKARPKTAAAIGAAIIAGAAALVGGPAAARALRGEEPKPAARRKPAAKKPAAKRSKPRD